MGKHKVVLFFLLIFSVHISLAAITKADSTCKDSTRKSTILPVPIVFYTPESGVIYSLSVLYTFYADAKDLGTRPSYMALTGIYTSKNQAVGDFYVNGWSKKNIYHYTAEFNYNKNNFLYYGIGNNTKLADEEKINEERLNLSFGLERKLQGPYYIGAEGDIKKEAFSNLIPGGVLNEATTVGATGGLVSRLGIVAIYDTRDINTYSISGNLLKFTYSHTLPKGISDFNFNRILFESRSFYTPFVKHTFGFNTVAESIQGDQPFFELRPMGSLYIMRGYYTGRFRDQSYTAAQFEYRYHFARRWGITTFVGTGEVFNNNSGFIANELKPNYGLGLRYFYDQDSKLNFRIDYGWGQKVPGEPNRIGNVYFFVGEAF